MLIRHVIIVLSTEVFYCALVLTMAISSTLLAVLTALITLGTHRYLTSKPRLPQGSKLPPGPPGKPLVGNLLEIPPVHSWLKFKDWADVHGPLFRLSLAGREHDVVSTEKVANDLLRERGNSYSSREQLPAAVQLLGGSLRPLFYPHDETFRQSRKLMHWLCKDSAARYLPGYADAGVDTVAVRSDQEA